MRPEDRIALARTLAWSLLMAAWLQLGALGHAAWPLTATGLLPTAVWLGAIGLAQHAARDVRLSTPGLRLWLAAGAIATAGGLLGASAVPAAAFAAAAAWGVLLVAASRCVRALRRGAAPLPAGPAAIGAAIAWVTCREGAGASAALVATAALLLALLVPSGAVSRGCRSGLFDCVLPAVGSVPVDATGWLHAALRWAMLPMMATLVAMGDWCSASLGLGAQAMIVLHLAAMLLPPLALRLCGCTLRGPLWAATPLPAALLLLVWPPVALRGLPGLAAASLACAIAWGLSWQAHRPGPSAPAQAGPLPSLVPALAVIALGIALEHVGPPALGWALALSAAAALAGAAWCGTRQTLQPLRRPVGHQ